MTNPSFLRMISPHPTCFRHTISDESAIPTSTSAVGSGTRNRRVVDFDIQPARGTEHALNLHLPQARIVDPVIVGHEVERRLG